MISLDRDSGVSLVDQLIHQIKFQIASGRYQVGDKLPSTRALGASLDVSFHTVRKAYRTLVDEGIVEARSGRGFVVKALSSGGTSQRLEKGAAIAASAIQQLVTLGLADHEIEALLFEQYEQQQESRSAPVILFAAPYRELSDRCSELIQSAINLPIDPVTVRDLATRTHAEYVITPFSSLREVAQALPDAHAIGVTVFYAHAAQEALARLTSRDTVAVAVEDATSVEPIMIDIRRHTGFSGQVFGISAFAPVEEFASVLEEVDLLLYTHQSRRRVQSKTGGHLSVELDPRIAIDSIAVVKQVFALW